MPPVTPVEKCPQSVFEDSTWLITVENSSVNGFLYRQLLSQYTYEVARWFFKYREGLVVTEEWFFYKEKVYENAP